MIAVNPCTGEAIATARTYAEYLASYISDASTVRIRTLEQFGFAPTRDEIQIMRDKAGAARAAPWNAYQLPKYDGSRMDRWVDPSPPTPPEPKPVAFVPRNRPAPITPDEIIAQIAGELGSCLRDVAGSGRARKIIRVRFLIAGLMVERGNSYSHVGMMLGERDHSTIQSACAALPVRLKRDPELMATYDKYCALWGLSGRFRL